MSGDHIGIRASWKPTARISAGLAGGAPEEAAGRHLPLRHRGSATQAELIEELCYMRAEVAYLKELKALSQKQTAKDKAKPSKH